MKFETAHLHSLQERNTEARPRSFDDRGVILEPSAGGGISVDVVSYKLKRAGYNITSTVLNLILRMEKILKNERLSGKGRQSLHR